MTDTTEVAVTETFLTKDQIVAAEDRQTETVDVPEWGGRVRVRGLDGTARDAYEASLRARNPKTKEYEPNLTNATAKLVARCIVDLKGDRLFSDGEVSTLGHKSGGALQRVYDVAVRLSGLGAQAEQDAEGNSETDPSDGSTSDEPTPPE